MANKGTLDGKILMSKAAWENAHGETTRKEMVFGAQYDFTQGGFCKYSQELIDIVDPNDPLKMGVRENKGRQGFYGWEGFGGSTMQWNPTTKIGFAYITPDLVMYDFGNTRAAEIQGVVQECVSA